ncbi:carbamoyltransferase N-terminal domain-containing protein [Fibrella sp. WM1]|uniref:carbamoyltransferase N-terminal domain-containing protein n=1 Tax=Fibrella musci TaxID=3242485 RepID=UPI00352024ED
MIICGLKLTHDGSIAVIKDNTLLFSIEIEKLKNNPRYASIEETNLIEAVLEDNGIRLDEVDQFAIDGWGGYDQEALAIQPRLTIGETANWLSATHNGQPIQLAVAQYQERTLEDNILTGQRFSGLPIGRRTVDYTSYLHVTGHVMSAYCTSPFAAKGQGSYVLVWDGGMYPRLYYVSANSKKVENIGPIFLLIGNMYTIFSQHFGPYKVTGGFAKDNLSVAGKVMAYIALGTVRRELLLIFDEIYANNYDAPMGFANQFAVAFKQRIEGKGYSDEDVLATFHVFLEELLVLKLAKKIGRFPRPDKNLCLVGGCALNIKWNSAVRENGMVNDVYVPPFPNDSGSAIGAACTLNLALTGNMAIDWNVYSGPFVAESKLPADWQSRPCDLTKLAELLHTTGEPVVFLNGRAELGPRALGNRSILAPAHLPAMKDRLNDMKKREPYRPVSPICLERAAANIFLPGTPDPYMLFDHQVRPEWKERIPAVCHIDDSARLQTINAKQNPQIAALLEAYYALSGIPLLCNTSANFNGKGFFPDVQSVMTWGQVNYIWSDNVLYERMPEEAFSGASVALQEVA